MNPSWGEVLSVSREFQVFGPIFSYHRVCRSGMYPKVSRCRVDASVVRLGFVSLGVVGKIGFKENGVFNQGGLELG